MDNFNSFMSAHVANMPQCVHNEVSLMVQSNTFCTRICMLGATMDESRSLVNAVVDKAKEISEKSTISIRDAFDYIAHSATKGVAHGVTVENMLAHIEEMDSIDSDDEFKQKILDYHFTVKVEGFW